MPEPEDIGGAVERIGQRVDVGAVVVEVEARPGGRRCTPSDPHQRLGAVVAGADAHVALVEHLADVVGVDVAEGEAEHAAAHLDVVGAVDRDVVAVALVERVEGVAGELHLVPADLGHAESSRYSTAAPNPIASVIGGVPASNLAGTGAVVNPSRRTSAIMLPPPRNGGIASSSSMRPHSTPMPDGPHILWLENATKSASQAWTSVALCGHVLAGVDDRERAGIVGGGAELGHRRERAEHVAHRGEREHLGAVEQLVEVGQVELAVGGERDPAHLDAALGGEHLPRHDVGVVLHVGEHDDVAVAEVGPAPRRGRPG